MQTRKMVQSDVEAAQRGLNMLAMSPSELADLMAEFPETHEHFAARVIHEAARQLRVVKLAMGAR